MNMTLNLVGWLFYLIGMIWGTIREKKENQKIKDATSFLGEAIKTGDTEIYEVKGKNSEIEKEFIDFNNPRKRFWYYLKRWFKNKVRKIKSHF